MMVTSVMKALNGSINYTFKQKYRRTPMPWICWTLANELTKGNIRISVFINRVLPSWNFFLKFCKKWNFHFHKMLGWLFGKTKSKTFSISPGTVKGTYPTFTIRKILLQSQIFVKLFYGFEEQRRKAN